MQLTNETRADFSGCTVMTMTVLKCSHPHCDQRFNHPQLLVTSRALLQRNTSVPPATSSTVPAVTSLIAPAASTAARVTSTSPTRSARTQTCVRVAAGATATIWARRVQSVSADDNVATIWPQFIQSGSHNRYKFRDRAATNTTTRRRLWCVIAGILGDNCTVDADCYDAVVDTECGDDGRCQCVTGWYPSNDGVYTADTTCVQRTKHTHSLIWMNSVLLLTLQKQIS